MDFHYSRRFVFTGACVCFNFYYLPPRVRQYPREVCASGWEGLQVTYIHAGVPALCSLLYSPSSFYLFLSLWRFALSKKNTAKTLTTHYFARTISDTLPRGMVLTDSHISGAYFQPTAEQRSVTNTGLNFSIAVIILQAHGSQISGERWNYSECHTGSFWGWTAPSGQQTPARR